jgi:nitrate reductase (cytochrome), electron transfer subunit
MRFRALLVTGLILGLAGMPALAQQFGLRGPTPLNETKPAAPIPNDVNNDRRQARNWPEQPPVIPHQIRGYEITLNANRCLTCHGRQFTEQSQAPMISVTHFMDRDDQILATVSARRYFCTQCHAPQTDARPLVENRFLDIDTLVQRERASSPPRSQR